MAPRISWQIYCIAMHFQQAKNKEEHIFEFSPFRLLNKSNNGHLIDEM